MILVILGVCVGLLVLGVILYDILDMDFGIYLEVGSGIACVIAAIMAVILIVDVSTLSVIDEKIAMYQEENTAIEEQISAVVKQYQEYESEIFEESAKNVEADIILASLYPELKSNTLVQSQIEMYVANNNKIKELRESKISGSVSRWWLYFGK